MAIDVVVIFQLFRPGPGSRKENECESGFTALVIDWALTKTLVVWQARSSSLRLNTINPAITVP